MDGERFLREVQADLAESLSNEEVAAMSAFYGTPLGDRIKRAEIAGSEQAAQARVQARAAELLAELERDPERLGLYDRMDEALLTTELTATLVSTLLYASAAGGLEAQNRGAGPEALDRLRQSMAGMRTVLLPMMRQQVFASLADTYGPISIEDLAAYVEFIETEEARAVYSAFFAATNEIIEDRSREAGRQFAVYMKQKKI